MEAPRCRQCARPLTSESQGLCPHCLLTMVLEQPELPTTDRFGNYEPVAVLGEGGMAVVYLAEQTHPFRRMVALKVLKPGHASGELARRFDRERQSLAHMDHPNIGTIYDAGTSDAGSPYFAMEYVEGAALTAFADSARLSLDARIDLFLQVCDAVSHAHQRGILHRDLKPANILVARAQGHPQVKVIDFGLARLQDWHTFGREQLTGASQLLGTPEYMSPEHGFGPESSATPVSDVYSLGVVLYELLAGLLPFPSETWGSRSVGEILHVISNAQPPLMSARFHAAAGLRTPIATARQSDPSSLRRALAADLDAIVVHALEKDSARRYPTVQALAADLKSVRQRRPPSVRRRRALPRWFPGKRLWLLAAALAIPAVAFLLLHQSAPSPIQVAGFFPYTSGEGNQTNPSFAPDSRRIAYTWDGPHGDNYDIYSLDGPGAPPRRLTSASEDDVSPAWSPDGSQIAFLRAIDARSSRLILLDVASGSERPLIPVPGWYSYGARSLAWSPDGKWIALSIQQPGRRYGYPFLYSPTTGELRSLLEFPDDAQYLQPAFSPDGRQLAFIRDDHAAQTLHLLSLTADYRAAGQSLPLDTPAMSMYPAFLDSDTLLFRASLLERACIWRKRGPGHSAEPFPVLGEEVDNFALSPDRRHLAMARLVRDVELFHFRRLPNGAWSPPATIASSAFADYLPTVSPDQRQVAFLSSRSGKQQVWLANLDGSALRQLTFGDDVRHGLDWEPDGHHLRFVTRQTDVRRHFRVDTAGGAPIPIPQSEASVLRYSPDGKTIYFAVGEGNTRSLHRAPAANPAQSVPVTNRVVTQQAFSPDRASLYFYSSHKGKWALFRTALQGDRPEELVCEDAELFDPAVSNQGVYYVRRLSGRRYAIVFWSSATRAEKIILELDRKPWMRLQVSPAGDSLVVDVAKTDGRQIRVAEIANW